MREVARKLGGSSVLLAWWLCALLTSACLENPAVTCKNAIICAPGNVCDDAHGGCATSSQVVACSGKAQDAACTYPGVPDGACYEGVCLPAGCGNGFMAIDEVCDDGNRFYGDGCSADCRSNETCGNGLLDAFTAMPEQCDDGNTVDGDNCHANCTLPVCGDGVFDPQFNEACDDGPNNSDTVPDACRINCQRHFCGDTIVDGDEACDDGNTEPGDRCFYNCQSDETCGNGFIDVTVGEQCDDSDLQSHDRCSSRCMLETGTWELRKPGPATLPNVTAARVAYDAGRGKVVLFGDLSGDTWEFDGAEWTNIPASAATPPARNYEGLAYDAARRQVVMFGGADLSPETWAWNGQQWTDVTPNTPSPPIRQRNAMAYDPVRKKIVMFGGQRPPTTFLRDTWEWDGSAWANVTPASGSPTLSLDDVMTYDFAHGTMLMVTPGASSQTWQWNGSAWSNVTPATHPAVANVSMAFDGSRGEVVLQGSGQTWAWNGSSWTNITPVTTNPSSGTMVYDVAHGNVVLVESNGTTWKWNGSAWASVAVAAAVTPPVNMSTAMQYDVVRGNIVLFGGVNTTTQYTSNETWQWHDGTWSNITPVTESPPARYDAASAYDPIRRKLVVFGGRDGTGSFADTWEWDGTAWTTTAPAIVNAGFEAPALAAGQSQLAPTSPGWTFSGDSGIQSNGSTWLAANAPEGTQTAFLENDGGIAQTISLPAGSYAVSLQWARHDTQVQPLRIRVDGTDVGSAAAPASSTFVRYTSAPFTVTSGTHTISLECTVTTGNLGTFVDAVSIVSAGPSARWGSQMVFDAARGKVVLFSGTSGLNGDTWEWDGTTWKDVTPTVSPRARGAFGMAYDAKRARVVVFGGAWGGLRQNDTWEWDGAAWANVTPAGGPVGRERHAMTYDASLGQVVMFGGIRNVLSGESGNFNLDDSWRWDGSAWTPITTLGAMPAKRTFHAMAYDAAHLNVVMFGGSTDFETWTLRYDTSSSVEGCGYGIDNDGDGLVGCADPDCFGYCSPQCNPTLSSCAGASPRCGDGTCQPIETKRLCPADCGGAPTPVCGDFLCESPETMTNCPGDCS